MFLHHSEDNTGKIEDIVDEKLATSGFVDEEKVTEMIAAAQLEPVVPDVYLTKREAANTYSTFDNVTNTVRPVSEALSALTSSVSTIDAKFNDYATTAYVDQKIADIPSPPEFDPSILEPYATIQYVDSEIAKIPSGGGGEFDPSILEPYATIQYVDTKIAEIPSGGGGDVTKAYVDQQIANHNHNAIYYTKQEVDTKIAEIPSGGGEGGKIEVIDNDLTINGDVSVKGLLENKLKTWQVHDDYVNWYPINTFKIEYETHDDTTRIIYIIPKETVNIIHPGNQIDGEWLIQCYLDSEGTTTADFRYEFVHTFETVEAVQINDNVSFQVTDDSYRLVLDNTAFRWSQYYGIRSRLVSCKIYENSYTTIRMVPDADWSDIGVSNTNSIKLVMYDDNFAVARHTLTLMDLNGHMSLPGDLTVPGTIYNRTMKNAGDGDVEVLTPYATQSYVDRKIEDGIENGNFAQQNHTHDETYYTKTEVDAKIAENAPEIPNDLTLDTIQVKQSLQIGDDGWFGWLIPTQKGITLSGQLTIATGALNVNRPETLSSHQIQGNVLFNNGEIEFRSNVNFTGSVSGLNETITHKTNCDGEIGTFCETNGGIYDGYEKIDTTDCICQVIQSTTLNAKIVGVITSENQFASHGDVLMQVVPGTYKLGDILAPDITGRARVATETELQYMMLHAIPRPKITSLNTGIANTVACFIV